ncbi:MULTISPECIES: GNAT family N-acetyltransferase [unclassified Streptomyces]|uniref:GNAT family N-acetyltransferase n=1 Tax=unclassified Streptomyces TaxID=2593676 RepID=UPI0036EF1D1B
MTEVRGMTAADCPRVAEIRVGGWRTAYRGLVPQPYLDAMDVTEETELLRTRLRQGDGNVVNLVAERDGEVLGWAAHGPYRDGERHTPDAELYALYVHPGHHGAGLGHALLQESMRRCTAAGHARMYLWVLEGNHRARRFYERGGFHADGAQAPFEVAGVAVPEVRYVRAMAVQRR